MHNVVLVFKKSYRGIS